MTITSDDKKQDAVEENEEQERDPVDELLPRWIEFSRLGNKKEITEAVKKFFTDEKATADIFKKHFGVDLEKFQGYYLETGAVDAPQGPLTPTRVTPILVLQQSRSGKSFAAHIFKHDGLMHDSRMYAWIERKAWDEHVQDTFAEEIREQAIKMKEAQKRAAEKMSAEQANGKKEE